MRRAALLPVIAVLTLTLVGFASLPAVAAPVTTTDGAPSAPTIFSLSADGEVSVVPDIAVIQFGVTTSAHTAAAALKDNRDRMNQAIALMKAAGLAPRDIQTTGISLNPQYDYQPNLPPRLTGYQASNSVSAIVRDLAKAGTVMDAVTTSSANQINGISFDISDRAKAEDDARRLAVRALQAKADLYATATGLHILRLASLAEGGDVVQRPQPMMMLAMAKSADARATPVEPGELKVRVSISGVYELGR